MMQKMEEIISGRGNHVCKGPVVGKAVTSWRSGKEASEAGRERGVWGRG